MREDEFEVDVCGRVNGYDLVRRLSNKNMKNLPRERIRKIKDDYLHSLLCGDCLDNLGSAYEEFGIGNSKFKSNVINENMAYLEGLLV